jgi:hypothetical protein
MQFFFFFIISKYCSISNNKVNIVVTDMSNLESNTDFDSSKEVYNININSNWNNIVNIISY